MNWSQNLAYALMIMVAIFAIVGCAAGFAIFVQIFSQGGWKLAEPTIRKARWRMVRPWMLVGAGVGLIFGIAIVFLTNIDQTAPAPPGDVINSPPAETKARPRDGA